MVRHSCLNGVATQRPPTSSCSDFTCIKKMSCPLCYLLWVHSYSLVSKPAFLEVTAMLVSCYPFIIFRCLDPELYLGELRSSCCLLQGQGSLGKENNPQPTHSAGTLLRGSSSLPLHIHIAKDQKWVLWLACLQDVHSSKRVNILLTAPIPFLGGWRRPQWLEGARPRNS
jgi:hypothetical protein